MKLSSEVNYLQGEFEQKNREYTIQYAMLNDLSRQLGEKKEEAQHLSDLLAGKERESENLRAQLHRDRKLFEEDKIFLSSKLSEAELEKKEILRAAEEAKLGWAEEKEKLSSAQEEVKEKAVEDFRSSTKYEEEKAAYASASYEAAFNLCKEQMARLFPDCDLSKIQMLSDDEDEEGEASGSWTTEKN